MAIEDLFKSNMGKGIAIGIGVAVLAPLVLPTVARAARPMARAAIKSGLLLFEKGQETVAELGEVIDDLLAEAQAEIEQNRQQGDNVDDVTEETIVETVVETTDS
ncbi:MAG: hypothetical protein AMJ53_04195 [Gammaproteobacteria bacterium SG8_11]|nr:MAG: hypothetical protein AMJ53_04195 [Gammaproteobacteria bacterium SG8_11]